jgi:type I restriction enzyme, R subunit
VDRAIVKVFTRPDLSEEQQAWIGYIRDHLVHNLTIEKEDFDISPILEMHGGWGRFKKVFGDDVNKLLQQINSNIAA